MVAFGYNTSDMAQFYFCVDDERSARYFFFSCRRRHTSFDCDWSSDVCSSDLAAGAVHPLHAAGVHFGDVARHDMEEIGRASCRERVEISVGAVSLKKKKKK